MKQVGYQSDDMQTQPCTFSANIYLVSDEDSVFLTLRQSESGIGHCKSHALGIDFVRQGDTAV
jgi:hypothetical protein